MPSKSLSHEFNGVRYEGYLAWNSAVTGPRPGVLVIHEATGIGEHARERADRIAEELGYSAFAMDLFGENPSSVDGMLGWIGRLLSDPAELHGRLRAGLAALCSDPCVDPARIGAIGYCFGGTAAIELGRCGADVKAIAALKTHASPSVRIAAVVALRRLERPEVGQFLNDANGRVILEAARAISEIPIPQALPALAALQPDFGKLTAEQRPALARRILSANYRLGDAASAGRLASFAGNADLPEAARAEALDLLAE